MSPRSSAALLAVALVLGAGGAACAQPKSPELERAKALRDSDPDCAEAIVRGVLARSPNDYFALYHLGLIIYGRGARAPEGPDRLTQYRSAAAYLEKARAVRPVHGAADATIFNTLGVIYLAAGDLGRAQASFDEGLRNQSMLSPGSRAKLYSNIGYLKTLQGKYAEALPALQQASTLGNADARTNLGRVRVQQQFQQQMQMQKQVPTKQQATPR